MDARPLVCSVVWIVTLSVARCRLVEVNVGVFVEVSDQSAFSLLNSSLTAAQSGGNHGNITYSLSPRTVGPGQDTYHVTRAMCVENATLFVSLMPCGGASTSLAHLAARQAAPVLSWRSCDQAQTAGWPFTMTSLGVHLHTVVLDIVRATGWRHLVFVYDQSADMYVVQTFLSELGEQLVTWVQLDNDSAFHSRPYQAWTREENFILYCSLNSVLGILRESRVNRLDILGPRYKWVLLDTGDLTGGAVTSQLMEGDNLVIVRQHKLAKPDIISDGAAVISDVVTSLASEGYDLSPVRYCEETRRSGLNEELRRRLNLTLPPENKTGDSYAVWTYGRRRRGDLGMTHVGDWTKNSGLDMWGPLFPQLKEGFNNRTFVIATLEYEPFVFKDLDGNWSGILIDMLEELRFALNFSYVLRSSGSNVFGIDIGNGSFNGIVGEVQRKEVDFALAPLSIIHERAQVVDFTNPFWDDPYIVLMRRPDPGDSKTFICLGPFSQTVWFVIALSVIVVSVVLWLSLRYYPGVHLRCSLSGYELMKMTTWQTFGALMQQGMVTEPVISSGRLIVAMWWFYVIIIAGVYNGNLIAFLTAPKVDLPINSLSDLAHSDFMFGTLKDAAFHGTLESATTGIYRQLWAKVKNDVDDYFYASSDGGLRRVLQDGKYAYIIEKSYYTMLHVKTGELKERQCEFARPKADFLANMYGLAFQKDSPYTNIFSMQILRILESGLLERIKHKWLAGANRCTGLERVSAQTNIGLLEAQGAFYILAIGVVAAVLVLFVEFFVVSPCCRTSLFRDLPFAKCCDVEKMYTVRSEPDLECSTPVPEPAGGTTSRQDLSESLNYVDIMSGIVTVSNMVYDPGRQDSMPETASNGVHHNGVSTYSGRKSRKRPSFRSRSLLIRKEQLTNGVQHNGVNHRFKSKHGQRVVTSSRAQSIKIRPGSVTSRQADHVVESEDHVTAL